MERLKVLFGGKPKVEKKFIRDSKGRPYYLTSLRFYQRYPRTFVLGGGFLAACIAFSGVIYHMIFTDPTDLPPEAFLWPRERETGITNLERIRMKYPRPEKKVEVKESK